MSLTKPDVNELALEQSVLDLFGEFLTGYFDGQPHTVGLTTNVAFPVATLKFQQSALPQPLKGAAISLVWNSPGIVRRSWENLANVRQEVCTTQARWSFWVRAELPDIGDAKALGMDVAQKLFGLLTNSAATRPLAQRGIHRLRPSTPAFVTDTGYVLRVVPCTAQLRWFVRSQT